VGRIEIDGGTTAHPGRVTGGTILSGTAGTFAQRFRARARRVIAAGQSLDCLTHSSSSNEGPQMAKRRKDLPGANQYRQATNFIGQLLFDPRMRNGSMSFSVKSTRSDDVTTITVLHPDGVMEFYFTDEEAERDLTPRQREARRLIKENPDLG
jgi:hypothetical protein